MKILDFGIARAASFAEEEAKKGLIKGKVAYLAPEQVNMQPFDHRIDLFALGVVMHEMMTGQRLFQAKNDVAKMRQLLAAPIPLPSSINAAVPRELDRIVMKALEVDPSQRYQSATAMANDLERTLIAARHSSRDLAKLLRGLFLEETEEPIVVVDEVAPPAPVGPPTGSMSSVRSSTQEISERTRSSRTQLSPGGKLDGALRAEQSRLIQQRRNGQAKAAVVLVALVAIVGVGVKVWPHVAPFVHELLVAPPPPAPAPRLPSRRPRPSSSRRPRPRRVRRPGSAGPKGRSTAAGKAAGDVARPTGGGDDVIPPSE